MTMRHRGHFQAVPTARATPAPAGEMVIETFLPWKVVQRRVRKRIVKTLGEPGTFAVIANTDSPTGDTPLL